MTDTFQPCIIVHGGAFNISESYWKRYKEGTQSAARSGYAVLIEGGSALDAVEKAVQSLEDDPVFNAGHGSVLTESGTIEMDAIIVDGRTTKTGGVTCVRDIANPVSLARKVMEETCHCLLCGKGAMKFAKSINFPILSDPSKLISNESVCKSFVVKEGTFDAHIEAYMNQIVNAEDISDLESTFKTIMKENRFSQNGHDTVGAVAIDNDGNIACATSTGGMPGKKLGRVGDSPLLGCGAYANATGGCSSTGHGECLIRSTVCREAVFYLEQGLSAQDAAQKSIDRTLDMTGGRGGIILIDQHGKIGKAFTTSNMAWASVSPRGLEHGLLPGEANYESL